MSKSSGWGSQAANNPYHAHSTGYGKPPKKELTEFPTAINKAMHVSIVTSCLVVTSQIAITVMVFRLMWANWNPLLLLVLFTVFLNFLLQFSTIVSAAMALSKSRFAILIGWFQVVLFGISFLGGIISTIAQISTDLPQSYSNDNAGAYYGSAIGFSLSRLCFEAVFLHGLYKLQAWLKENGLDKKKSG